jgi:hypothetical protein
MNAALHWYFKTVPAKKPAVTVSRNPSLPRRKQEATYRSLSQIRLANGQQNEGKGTVRFNELGLSGPCRRCIMHRRNLSPSRLMMHGFYFLMRSPGAGDILAGLGLTCSVPLPRRGTPI